MYTQRRHKLEWGQSGSCPLYATAIEPATENCSPPVRSAHPLPHALPPIWLVHVCQDHAPPLTSLPCQFSLWLFLGLCTRCPVQTGGGGQRRVQLSPGVICISRMGCLTHPLPGHSWEAEPPSIWIQTVTSTLRKGSVHPMPLQNTCAQVIPALSKGYPLGVPCHSCYPALAARHACYT